MGTVFTVICIGFIVFIAILMLWKKKKPTPNPTPDPTPTPIPTQYQYYMVVVYNPEGCNPIGTSHIANSVKIDEYIGHFYYNTTLNRIEEIIKPEYGDPAALTNYTGPGTTECPDVSLI